jgi:hypothetical protein
LDDAMLEPMREQRYAGRKAEAVDCAVRAAPYFHPRLNAIDGTVKHSVEERDDPIDRLLAEVGGVARRTCSPTAGETRH